MVVRNRERLSWEEGHFLGFINTKKSEPTVEHNESHISTRRVPCLALWADLP